MERKNKFFKEGFVLLDRYWTDPGFLDSHWTGLEHLNSHSTGLDRFGQDQIGTFWRVLHVLGL